MSAEEILNSLGIDLDPELIIGLDEQLTAVDEIQTSEGEPTSAPKLALVDTGSTIYARFSPDPSGSGACTKKWTGVFTRPQATFQPHQ